MRIQVGEGYIEGENAYLEKSYYAGVTRPTLRLELKGGITDEQLNALASNDIRLLDDDGNELGVQQGFNVVSRVSVCLCRMESAEATIAALEEQLQAAAYEKAAAIEAERNRALNEMAQERATLLTEKAAALAALADEKTEALRQAGIQREAALRAVRDETELTIAETLESVRAGLTEAVVQGEAWDAAKRYISGDRVVSYVALRYSKGKAPADNPEYWAIDAGEEQILAWADIPDLTVIEPGQAVTYGGAVWRCISQHLKSTVFRPKEGSKWMEIVE